MHKPRKRFGQHFLEDPAVIDNIVAVIAPRADDVLIEIGPGRGAITEPLSRLAGALHAIEFDRDLARALHARFAASTTVTIHEADALAFDYASLGRGLRLVGNLPYNISTPLLFHLLTFAPLLRDLHFMLQKEVVDRMSAAPGSRKFGRLTVMLGCRMRVVRLFDVPQEAFAPPPRVMSALVRLEPLPEGTYRIDDHAKLSAIVRQAFSQRRKTVRNALRGRADEIELCAAGIDPGARPEQIPVSAWIDLANRL